MISKSWKSAFRYLWVKQATPFTFLTSIVLRPLSWIYGAIATLRNLAYDLKALKINSVDIPVISVGNLTSGGTGKTPLVEFLAQMLGNEYKIGIITRGYHSEAEKKIKPSVVSDGSSILLQATQAGDEALCLAQTCPKAVVIAGPNRYQSSLLAQKMGCQLLILDDGFQHRKVKRSLDLVVLSSHQFKYRRSFLPYGPYREPFTSLKRADLVLIHHNSTAQSLQSTKELASSYKTPICVYKRSTPKLLSPNNKPFDFSKKTALITAIGQPEPLIKQLSELDVKLYQMTLLDDHQALAEQEWKSTINDFDKKGIKQILTTRKDFVKIPSSIEKLTAFYTVENKLELIQNEKLFLDAIQEKLKS